MYRDSRESVEALAGALEAEVEEAQSEVASRKAAVASPILQAFPFFDGLAELLEPYDLTVRAIVVGLLVPMSLAALPLALLTRSQRGDLRALRRARRELKRLEGRREETHETLKQLKAPTTET